MAPVLWILTQLSSLVGRFVGLKPSEGDRRVTEEEIRSIVEESSKTGNIDEEEGEMIQNGNISIISESYKSSNFRICSN